MFSNLWHGFKLPSVTKRQADHKKCNILEKEVSVFAAYDCAYSKIYMFG